MIANVATSQNWGEKNKEEEKNLIGTGPWLGIIH
jgi:hypothetical protein